MDRGTRLRRRRLELGLTLEQVADAVGVSKSTVQKWESGVIEDMRLNKAAALAKILKVSPLWIMGISESMTGPSKPQMKRVPILGRIAAGDPILATEEYGDYVELGDDGIQVDFCLRVKGDSMRDARIMDGDLVFVRRQPTVQNGEIAVVLIDDEVTLKRFYITEQGIILKPENPAYQPMFVSHEDFRQVRILGRAVAFQSKL